MIHARSIPNSILFVGDDRRLPQIGAMPAVAAGSPRLSDLAKAGADALAGHPVVLFETEGGQDDLAALADCLSATGGQTVFVALADENLPLARARALTEAGAADVLPLDVEGTALADTLTGLLDRRRAPAAVPVRAGTILAVAQSRGGVGGTTVAANLAVALATDTRKNAAPVRVALLDLDLQFGNAGTFFDLEDNGAMLDLMSLDRPPEPGRITRGAQSSGLGVDVITAPAVFVPLTAMTPDLVAAIIAALRGAYDYVIIDMPRATLDWIAPVIEAADRLILVSDGSVPCIRQAKRIMDLYRETSVSLPVDLVMNREKKPMFGSEMLRDAEDLLGLKVASWIPEGRAAERRAVDLGQPSASRRGPSRKTYRRLARHMVRSVNTNDKTAT
ncbi:CpaE family protein [Pseudooceanicola sp. LIPI14-2-Ac024]|uniref:AAA family ATPase n=1 Tax=Pseudooceanicola sp. LIPI14-2-Ac024 TaxID=3344875 RepID=UPI0035CFD894